MSDTPKISKEDAEEFTQTLGQITGGSWRQIALATRLGVPDALGLTAEDWVQSRLGGYVKLTVEDRREAAKELVAQGQSQREAAAALGVNQATVGRDLKADDANASPKPRNPRNPRKDKKADDANASPINAAASLAPTAEKPSAPVTPFPGPEVTASATAAPSTAQSGWDFAEADMRLRDAMEREFQEFGARDEDRPIVANILKQLCRGLCDGSTH